MVTLSTVYQTLIIVFLVYLSRGWIMTSDGGLDLDNLEAESQEMASLSLLVGAVYVLYCAYFLTLDLVWMQAVVGILLNTAYIFLLVKILKNCARTRQILSLERQIIAESHLDVLKPANKLKRWISL